MGTSVQELLNPGKKGSVQLPHSLQHWNFILFKGMYKPHNIVAVLEYHSVVTYCTIVSD